MEASYYRGHSTVKRFFNRDERLLIGKGARQLFKPLFGSLEDRLSVTGKECVEVEGQESLHAGTKAQGVIYHLFRQKPASS